MVAAAIAASSTATDSAREEEMDAAEVFSSLPRIDSISIDRGHSNASDATSPASGDARQRRAPDHNLQNLAAPAARPARASASAGSAAPDPAAADARESGDAPGTAPGSASASGGKSRACVIS